MYIRRNLTAPFVLRSTWPALLWSTLWAAATLTAFFVFNIKWIDVPFQLVSAVGIAVSFFIGFKNNQAYERFWEGRKIWGSIVNLSRSWTIQVLSLPTGTASGAPAPSQKALVYRHLAWINALRVQLRQSSGFGVRENFLMERFVAAHRDPTTVDEVIAPFVSADERAMLQGKRNVASQLVLRQAEDVRALRHDGTIDGFGQMMLQQSLESCYELQGMCERIKNTPFPRQYAFFSHVFTIIFCLLLPLGLLDVYEEELLASFNYAQTFDTPYIRPTDAMLFAMVPLSVLVSWIFLTWEKIGDSSEDPFEGRPHDVSMSALCRSIEIDLRDMLDEGNLPDKLQPRDHILY
ncbi:hypothetical protein GRI97_04340 [Altererythrobacter xixiisoli]|uniref:Bestrophin n=1 Tax=Croceibacterium xixiisoli TaxID=1476466 RepID=A0A6I4TQR0_9SPHN|nr:bestrophin family ion channel [Croceibacterium xixiisoli]MXO98214.1 hypothetical protein [Croceibacterium xixiisoli]